MFVFFCGECELDVFWCLGLEDIGFGFILFKKIYLVSWCCGRLVMCAWCPKMFHQGSLVWHSVCLFLGVVSFVGVCAKLCGVLWAMHYSLGCVFVEEVCASLCV